MNVLFTLLMYPLYVPLRVSNITFSLLIMNFTQRNDTLILGMISFKVLEKLYCWHLENFKDVMLGYGIHS